MIFAIGLVTLIVSWFVAKVMTSIDPVGYLQDKYWYLGIPIIAGAGMMIFSIAKFLWNLMP